MFAKIIMLTLIFVGAVNLFKWAVKAWKSADVEDKLQDQKDTVDIANKIKKKADPDAKKAGKTVEKFLK